MSNLVLVVSVQGESSVLDAPVVLGGLSPLDSCLLVHLFLDVAVDSHETASEGVLLSASPLVIFVGVLQSNS